MRFSGLKIIVILIILPNYFQVALGQDEPSFSLENASIKSIQYALMNHQLNCETLINAYLERIKQYNLSTHNGAPFNAFTALNSQIISQARELDAYFKQNKQLMGPLHCIPTVVKDNIDVKGMETTAGSLALLGTQPKGDAFLVTKLRQAGAIILGKTSMDEFSWGLRGISSRSGRIGNAYQPWKNPGGSSGGSAVAVSANFAVVAIGTDNSGSVRVPAAFNGVIGLRPSTGLISQSGIFPMGNLDGIAGPITKNIEDLAIVLDVIAKEDVNDAKTHKITRPATYIPLLNVQNLKGKRIGIVTHVGDRDVYEGMPQQSQQVLQKAFKLLREHGVLLKTSLSLSEFNNERTDNQAGEIEEINEYFRQNASPIKIFADICHSNKTRNFGNTQECLDFMKNVPAKNSPKYNNVLNIFDQNKKYVEAFMARHHLDALLIPITRTGIPTYEAKMINTWRAPVSSNAGLPAIALIAGFHPEEKLPVGFELIGRFNDEANLIQMAYAYEKIAQPRLIPQMPIANQQMRHCGIVELNHLFTALGENAYENILKNGKPTDLTAENFNLLTKDTLKALSLCSGS